MRGRSERQSTRQSEKSFESMAPQVSIWQNGFVGAWLFCCLIPDKMAESSESLQMFHIKRGFLEDTFFFGVVSPWFKTMLGTSLTPGRHSYTVSLLWNDIEIRYLVSSKTKTDIFLCHNKRQTCRWAYVAVGLPECVRADCAGASSFSGGCFSSIFPAQYWGVVILVLTCFNRRSWTWNEGRTLANNFTTIRPANKESKTNSSFFFKDLMLGWSG